MKEGCDGEREELNWDGVKVMMSMIFSVFVTGVQLERSSLQRRRRLVNGSVALVASFRFVCVLFVKGEGGGVFSGRKM